MKARLKNGAVFATLLGMEACWAYVLLLLVNQAAKESISVPLMMLVLFLSTGVSGLFKRTGWPKAALTALCWLIWVPVMLLMIKAQLFPQTVLADSTWLAALPQSFGRILFVVEAPLWILMCSALLWWQGRRLAYLRPDFAAALLEFQLGLVILALSFFLSYQLKLAQSVSAAAAVVFFGLALVSLSTAHTRDDSWLFSSSKGRWTVVILVCIVIILLLGVLAGLVFTPQLIQVFINVFKWIWDGIEKLLMLLAGFLHISGSAPMESLPAPAAGPSDEDVGRLLSMPEWLRQLLRSGWTIVMCGLFLVAVWKMVSRLVDWMRGRSSGGRAETTRLKGALRQDLLDLLKKLFRWLWRFKFKEDAGSRQQSPRQVVLTRRLYSGFLRWAAAQGFPREPSQTPREYCRRLVQIKPENAEALEMITDQYLEVRYGAYVPTDESLDRLKLKWMQLKQSGLKKNNRRSRS